MTDEDDDLLRELHRQHNRQIDQLRDVDDKAMRSVRTATVIAGFVIAAVGITAREGEVLVGWVPFTLASVGLLLLSGTVFIGSSTYIITEYPGRIDRRRLPERKPPTHKDELIQMYRRWTDLTSQELTRNKTYVFYTVSSLFLGVLFLLIAGLQVAIPHVLPTCVPPQSVLCFWSGTSEIGIGSAVIFLTAISLRTLFMHDHRDDVLRDLLVAALVWISIVVVTELVLVGVNS